MISNEEMDARLVKFAKKIKPKILNFLLPNQRADTIGIDATGFSVENRSKHYEKRAALHSYRCELQCAIF